jgi:NAD(P)-dependent dehydrogenase (short-subunit alcohol dehydrogenase family)
MGAPVKKSLVAVTGCDSGIGAALVDGLLVSGYKVLAGYHRDPPRSPHADLICWHLDLLDPPTIAAFGELAIRLSAHEAPLAGLIHNAGVVLAAPVEHMPLAGVREVFEVNFFGIFDLTTRLVPALIRDRGRIIINGSLAGRVALPCFAPYAASKFAVEGFADSLRRELRRHGVGVALLETGAVATPIWDTSWERIHRELLPGVGERYRAGFEAAAAGFVRGGNAGMDSRRAAAAIVRLLGRRRLPTRVFLSDHPLLDHLKAVLPAALMDRLISKAFGI